ncbi:bifunctional 5,10-methylene-tetrahydrofolate dehydrogenase/5,10-methylene-tetrahydrofolate cyclohydrolase, partial [bacterium]|nr:bifunctional 5,10-methylene-tetrahydrofolate dehydrogenase/5,10-methylene-tetrahydrofolate cyclohydrolase [candidate division CSSED10-310 bacterium]
MARLMDGKAAAVAIRKAVRAEVEELAATGIVPGLAVVLVGGDPASQVYVRNKERACSKAGIHGETFRLGADAGEPVVTALIDDLNRRPDIHSILLQMPLPPGYDSETLLRCIDPDKDVDGCHPLNLGRLMRGTPLVSPCTPIGIMHLLEISGIELVGR